MRAAVDGLQASELALTPADRAELLDTIALEVTRLTRLVESVLDLSRLEAGAAAPRIEVWEVDDLLAQAVSDVAPPTACARATSTVCRRSPSMQPRSSACSVNVLDNALKYSVADVEVLAHADGARCT